MAVALIETGELEAMLERVVRKVVGERAPSPAAADLTTEQVAAELSLAEKTVRKYARTGRLKGKRRGQEWRFSREAVEAYRTCGSTSALARGIVASLVKG